VKLKDPVQLAEATGSKAHHVSGPSELDITPTDPVVVALQWPANPPFPRKVPRKVSCYLENLARLLLPRIHLPRQSCAHRYW
jgi:hypothetical protein